MRIDWESEINNLEVEDLDENGDKAPEMEKFKKGSKDTLTLEDEGKLTKVTTQILIFEHDNGNTFTSETHSLEDFGRVSLKNTLLLLKELKKKTT